MTHTTIRCPYYWLTISTLLVYATEQQKEEHDKTSMCDKRDRGITCMSLDFLRKNLFRGRKFGKKIFSNKNYCHVFDTRFAVFFPLPS